MVGTSTCLGHMVREIGDPSRSSRDPSREIVFRGREINIRIVQVGINIRIDREMAIRDKVTKVGLNGWQQASGVLGSTVGAQLDPRPFFERVLERMKNSPYGQGQAHIKHSSSCGEVWTECDEMSKESIREVAGKKVYTAKSFLDLLHFVAPKMMHRAEGHFSHGIAEDLDDPKYSHYMYWSNPLETKYVKSSFHHIWHSESKDFDGIVKVKESKENFVPETRAEFIDESIEVFADYLNQGRCPIEAQSDDVSRLKFDLLGLEKTEPNNKIVKGGYGISFAKEKENMAYMEGPVHGIQPKANAEGKGLKTTLRETEFRPIDVDPTVFV
ncbi:hypothetical protein IFM89_010496 [Coptis chinensis]|uniref:Uncharacterized protein n=1 Tax=Coptis chinensis TaxID=261450 RepID=A0A835GVT9_9MAGN|nr:hypothetical protein IFM89_010496 [Coptis chinensis]